MSANQTGVKKRNYAIVLSMAKTKIYLTRHGQSEGNVNGDIFGSDPPLTDHGLQQAAQLVSVFADIPIQAIYASERIRAQQTAALIAKARALEVKQVAALNERFFGVLEGKTGEEGKQMCGDRYHAFPQATLIEQLQWQMAPDAETFASVIRRTSLFLAELAATEKGTVLAISHANVMVGLLVHFGFATFNQLPYGSIQNTGFLCLESNGKTLHLKEVQGITRHDDA